MIARGGGLDDDRFALGVAASDEEGGLDLGARHRGVVFDALKVTAGNAKGRPPAVGTLDPGAHAPEGVDDPGHGGGGAATRRR